MIVLIAWRNILANKRRALLTIILTIFTTTFLVFGISWNVGSHDKMIRDAVQVYSGYLQIIGKDYHDNPDYDHLIYNLNEVKRIIKSQKEIDHYSARFETFALFSGVIESAGGMLIGIESETEQYVSRIMKSVNEGEYLTDSSMPYAIIGKDLAKKLKVKIGDKVTYISTAIDYSMAADNLVIKGIYETGSEFDGLAMFVSKKYTDEMFLAENVATQLVLLPNEVYRDKKLPELMASISSKLDNKRNEVISWETTLESMVQGIKIDEVFGNISLIILVSVIFFVIMIFSLISIIQRTKEIGVLRAIGTKPSQIFFMLVGEAIILGLIGIIIGGLIGSALAYHFHIHPLRIHVSADMMEQYKQYGMIDFSFPSAFNLIDILNMCALIFVMNILSVLYPIYKVNKYKPIEAINYV
ncbi:MAG: hypothetical protein A2Y40_08070 [Candidatus Margulisbacteria bacterium GWF2_35_9]|nr:MAG: hypothetical protein A2Y40_08070 [Candidatus Margulisbacteria bacterium GWF2_35_9]